MGRSLRARSTSLRATCRGSSRLAWLRRSGEGFTSATTGEKAEETHESGKVELACEMGNIPGNGGGEEEDVLRRAVGEVARLP